MSPFRAEMVAMALRSVERAISTLSKRARGLRFRWRWLPVRVCGPGLIRVQIGSRHAASASLGRVLG